MISPSKPVTLEAPNGSELPIFVKVMGIINIDGIGSSTCEMVSLYTRLSTSVNMDAVLCPLFVVYC
jgi:hypothetical protein